MKVIKITEDYILFDNGSRITFDHMQDCCECNYADFEQLADTGIEQENFKEPLTFEEVEDQGFRFGVHRLTQATSHRRRYNAKWLEKVEE